MRAPLPRRAALGALAGCALALAAAGPAAADQRSYVFGSPGLGDPYFPLAGNGGYDARHYSLHLDYVHESQAAGGDLDATVLMLARATENLRTFNLDLRGFEITRLDVDGRAARFTRSDVQEVTVTPRKPLRRGEHFLVRVDYEGRPQTVVDPDGSSEGWVATDDGAYVVNEPQGSPGWYPVNDNPRDKATFDFHITVPEGITALGNGRLLAAPTRKGKTTWHWVETSPMAPYLATATNGVFDFKQTRTPDGMPFYTAIDPNSAVTGRPPAAETVAKIPAMIDVFEQAFGPYPLTTTGAIVDNARFVGYALETQSKANYDRAPAESTVAHEISHEWFGNAVTLETWDDIWLHEGFAAWATWYWFESQGGPTTEQAARAQYDGRSPASSFWRVPPGNPGGPVNMFNGAVYTRGGMTLQQLRRGIGDDAFFAILRAWYRENLDGNATTEDFAALAERISGRDLDALFETWLYRAEKPASWE